MSEEKYVEMLEDGTLYDYITNLQEEIKKYQLELEKADSITQSCIFQGKQESEISFRNCLNKMTDYKSRIDKAISYIKENGCFNEEYKLCTKPFNTLKLDDLLDILQGVDKE